MNRGRRGGVALLLWGAFAMAGCEDRVGGTAPSLAPGLLGGTVARQKTAIGVEGAVLVLSDTSGVRATALSDATGRFRFSEMPPGEYEVQLVAPEVAGIDPLFEVLEPAAHEVQLGSEPIDLVFAVVGLVPARITGRVLCDGEPVVGMEVRVAGGEVDAVAVTDAGGLFTVLDLAPGVYTVLPLDAPCLLTPAREVVRIRPGEFVDLGFGG